MRNLNYKHKKLLKFMKEIYGENLADKRVLDVGGNDGLILSNLPESLMKVDFEIDIESLRQAEQEKVWGDVHWLPFKNRSFDICIFSEVLEHIHSPEKVVAEVTRVADEVILTTPNNSLIRKIVILPGLIIRRGLSFISPRFHQYRHIDIASILRGQHAYSGGYTTHVREYSWKEVKDFFKNEGFELRRFEAIGCFLSKPKFLGNLEKFPRFAGKMLMRFKRVEKTENMK